MKDLIWFSIPGAILILPIIFLFNGDLQSEDSFIGIILVSVPVCGFILHQAWRLIFEAFGGFSSKKRKVIHEIQNKDWKIKKQLNRYDAFHVWELTFYSCGIDPSFRDHDRGAWHYIMSFLSCFVASIFGILLFIYDYLRDPCLKSFQWIWVIIYILIAIIFFFKARLTRDSLEQQEIAILKLHEDKFQTTAEDLFNK